MLFPNCSSKYKRDEQMQQKFGYNRDGLTGAKLYTFAKYASTYYRKRVNENRKMNSSHSSGDSSDIYGGFFNENKWYNKWYIKLPLRALWIPKPRYHFEKTYSQS